MCLIITRKKNARVDWNAANRAARSNSDGYGIAWHDGKSLQVLRSLEWADVRKQAHSLQAKDVEFILHMRYATHGAVNLNNTHPFKLHAHQSFMAHNGIIHTLETPEGMCDSRVLADHIDTRLDADWHSDPAAYENVEELASSSRLAFMLADGEIVLVNEEFGAWSDGCWYSQAGAVSHRAETNWHDPSLWVVEEDEEEEAVETLNLHTSAYHQRRAQKLFDFSYSGLGPDGKPKKHWSPTKVHPNAPRRKK